MKLEKKHAIIIAATILPFGFVVLGLWKAYDLLKNKKKVEQ